MSGDAVVLAHGFTQTGANWGPIVDRLQRLRPTWQVRAVDLPGHGSATRLRRYLWGAADHLAAVGGRGTYVGYSMGGRVALHAALAHPDLVERLVLIGATAGIDDEAERTRRRRRDNELADDLMRRSLVSFLDDWLSQPLFAGLDHESAGRQHRLANTRAGLASSLRLAGTGTQKPLWDRLADIGCPTLIVVGADDTAYRTIAGRLERGIRHARLAVVDGAGHSVHLERPDETVEQILEFLAESGE